MIKQQIEKEILELLHDGNWIYRQDIIKHLILSGYAKITVEQQLRRMYLNGILSRRGKVRHKFSLPKKLAV